MKGQTVALSTGEPAQHLEDPPVVLSLGDRLVDPNRIQVVRREAVSQREKPPTIVVAGQVEHDGPKIGRGLRGVLDPMKRPRHPDERLLHDVLRRISVIDKDPGHTDERPRVFLVERGDDRIRVRPFGRWVLPSSGTTSFVHTVSTNNWSLAGDVQISRRKSLARAVAQRTEVIEKSSREKKSDDDGYCDDHVSHQLGSMSAPALTTNTRTARMNTLPEPNQAALTTPTMDEATTTAARHPTPYQAIVKGERPI